MGVGKQRGSESRITWVLKRNEMKRGAEKSRERVKTRKKASTLRSGISVVWGWEIRAEGVT